MKKVLKRAVAMTMAGVITVMSAGVALADTAVEGETYELTMHSYFPTNGVYGYGYKTYPIKFVETPISGDELDVDIKAEAMEDGYELKEVYIYIEEDCFIPFVLSNWEFNGDSARDWTVSSSPADRPGQIDHELKELYEFTTDANSQTYTHCALYGGLKEVNGGTRVYVATKLPEDCDDNFYFRLYDRDSEGNRTGRTLDYYFSGNGEDAEKPDEKPAPEVPDPDKDLEGAVDNLLQTVPAEDSSEDAKSEFDNQVKAVVDSIMKKLNDNEKVDSKLLADMEAVLESAYGVKVEEDDGLKAEGLLLGTGMTSYEATQGVTTIRLYEKSETATVSNATKESSEKVRFELAVELVKQTRDAENEITSFKTPVTVTVPMPDYYVATTSDASRDVVKSGDKEIAMELDEDSKTITFSTTELGKFTVGTRKASDDSNNNTNTTNRKPSGGGSSSRRSSTKKSNGASGNWQMQDGKWWFQYTDGTYPANKWEFINGKWYFFGEDGYITTGWQQINGKWYYLDAANGDMATGWKQDVQDGHWYYLDAANGDMATGWQQINGKWYYLNDQTNAAATWNYNAETSTWEYAGNGVRPYGSMYVNEVTPDGYQVGADGAYIG